MIIRQAQTCDYEDLTILLNLEFDGFTGINFDKFEDYIMTPNQYTYVGIVDCKIIATITVVIEHKLIHNYGKVAHTEDLAVIKNYQGEGYGKKMLEYAIEICKQHGVYKILATVEKDNLNLHTCLDYRQHEISLRRDL